jgi:outer membrane lipoprotein-sorting protein
VKREVGALVLLVCLAAVPAASQAGDERVLEGVTVEEVLRHAALAPQIVDYEGTKILSVLRGRRMETVTVSEARRRPGKTRLNFLSPEGVAGRLVIDDGLQTWHYEPRLHKVFIGPSLAPPVDAATTLPVDRFRVRLLGTEEVIGRLAVVLSLWPQQGQRERRLWIDRMTGVALRHEERDPDDGAVATAYFTRISFGLNVPDALFRFRNPAGARVIRHGAPPGPLLPVPVLERSLGFPLWMPQRLPGGFVLLGGVIVRDGPMLAAHLHYTDGARWLSLFAVPASRVGPPGGGDRVADLGEGARTLVVGSLRLVLWEARQTRLTLVAPLTMAEMVSLASAVAPVGR